MAKIPFKIKYRPQIESGEYKIETEDGFPVTILDWSFRYDSGSPYICVKITKNGKDVALLYSEDGKRIASECVKHNDLIIITPELAEWSEEDKMNLDWCIRTLRHYGYLTYADFLKHLPERFNLQPKQQKEQKESVTIEWPKTSNCLKNCKKCLAKCFYRKEEYEEKKSSEWSENDKEMLSSINQWLDEFEPQYVKKEQTWLNALPERFKLQSKQEQSEVDLEKEIDAVWNPRFSLGWDEKSLLSINRSAFETIARHFYELGLNARNEE